jgi:serine/threonine-protein kinase
MNDPPSSLRRFLADLKRRRVFRVAVVYAVVAFVVWQAAEIAVPGLNLPDWVLTLVILLTVLGFPIAVVLAWALEVTPEGVRRTEPARAEPTAAPSIAPPAVVHAVERKSIAVLPFADMSSERDQEYFCDGVAEQLLIALAQLPGLRVAARTSSFAFRGKDVGIREIGQELNVATVLEGSVRRSGDRLRVTAQLVKAEDGYHLWSQTYERELADVFAIQDEISRSIVDRLRPTLVGVAGRELVKASTRNIEAYDHYLQGRYSWHRRYKVGLETALTHFQKAIELDPEFALPYAGIADSYTVLGLYGYLPPEEARSEARAAAVRALELDDGLSEAHASLGNIHLWYTWEWATAEKEYARAIELNPGNVGVRCWYALLCAAQGRFAEAFDHAAAARRLDPLSTYVVAISGSLNLYAGEVEGAIRGLEEVLEKEPEQLFAVYMLGLAYSAASRHDDAANMAERAVSLSNRSSFYLGILAGTYARAGRDAEAMAVLDELTARMTSEYVSPLCLAWGYVALGEKKRGLDLLARAIVEQNPYLYWIHQDRWWDPIRSELRFAELAKQVGSGVMKRASAGGTSHD